MFIFFFSSRRRHTRLQGDWSSDVCSSDLIACFGLVLLSQLNAHSSLWDIIWRLVVIGIGQGLFQSPNTRALMGAAPPDEQGIASGLLSTSRVIGQALSVALAGTIFTGFGAAAAGVLLSSQGQSLSTSRIGDLQNTFLAGFHAAFIVCAAFAAIGIFTSLVRGNENKNRQTQPETQRERSTVTGKLS